MPEGRAERAVEAQMQRRRALTAPSTAAGWKAWWPASRTSRRMYRRPPWQGSGQVRDRGPDHTATVTRSQRRSAPARRDRLVHHERATCSSLRHASRGVNDPVCSRAGPPCVVSAGVFTPRLALHRRRRGCPTGGTDRRPMTATLLPTACVIYDFSLRRVRVRW